MLLSESARVLAEEVGSPRALQWEDNVLALQAAMYALEQVVVGRLLPCLDDTGIVGMGIDSCGEVIYSRLSKLLSARDDVIIAINRVNDRFGACSTVVHHVTLRNPQLDLSLSFDRLVQLSAGMCSVPRATELAHDDSTATPMSAEWFASALHNIINRYSLPIACFLSMAFCLLYALIAAGCVNMRCPPLQTRMAVRRCRYCRLKWIMF